MSGRKGMFRQTAGIREGGQDSEMTSANRIKRKWHHQTRVSIERNVREKEFQEITQSMAETARWAGFLPI